MTSPPNRLAQAVEIAAGAAYILVVAATLYLLFPGLRQGAQALAAHALFNYRYGVFLARRSKTASWVREAMEGRTVEEPKAG